MSGSGSSSSKAGAGAGPAAAPAPAAPGITNLSDLIKLPGVVTDFNLNAWVDEYIRTNRLVCDRNAIPVNAARKINAKIYPKILEPFIEKVQNLHTEGGGACGLHAIFLTACEGYRGLQKCDMIRLVKDFRKNVLPTFYQRGHTVTRTIGADLFNMNNDAWLQRYNTYLEDEDIRKIAFVCHLNIIIISYGEMPGRVEKEGYVQYVSGILGGEDTRPEWPTIILYGDGKAHWEGCIKNHRYIFSEEEDVGDGVPIPSIESVLRLVDLAKRNVAPAPAKPEANEDDPRNRLNFLIGKEIELKPEYSSIIPSGFPRGFQLIVSRTEEIRGGGDKSIVGVYLHNIVVRRVIPGVGMGIVDMPAIIPLDFINFDSVKGLTEPQKVSIQAEIDSAKLPHIERELPKSMVAANDTLGIGDPTRIQRAYLNIKALPDTVRYVAQGRNLSDEVDSSNEAALQNDKGKQDERIAIALSQPAAPGAAASGSSSSSSSAAPSSSSSSSAAPSSPAARGPALPPTKPARPFPSASSSVGKPAVAAASKAPAPSELEKRINEFLTRNNNVNVEWYENAIEKISTISSEDKKILKEKTKNLLVEVLQLFYMKTDTNNMKKEQLMDILYGKKGNPILIKHQKFLEKRKAFEKWGTDVEDHQLVNIVLNTILNDYLLSKKKGGYRKTRKNRKGKKRHTRRRSSTR